MNSQPIMAIYKILSKQAEGGEWVAHRGRGISECTPLGRQSLPSQPGQPSRIERKGGSHLLLEVVECRAHVVDVVDGSHDFIFKTLQAAGLNLFQHATGLTIRLLRIAGSAMLLERQDLLGDHAEVSPPLFHGLLSKFPTELNEEFLTTLPSQSSVMPRPQGSCITAAVCSLNILSMNSVCSPSTTSRWGFQSFTCPSPSVAVARGAK